MRAAGVLLLLMLLPGVPALQVDTEAASAGAGTVLVRWDADQPGGLELGAGSITGTLVDTYAQDRVDVDHPVVESTTGSFQTRTQPIPSGAGHLSLVRSESATVLVQPLAGSFEATLSAAEVRLRSVDEEVLERSHAYDSVGDASVQDGSDYAYRVHDVVAAEGRGPTEVEVRGDFLLYLWNVTVLQEAPGVAQTHHTGQWSTPGSTPLHRTDHHQHAIVVVRDGHLRLQTPLGGTLYAPEMLLHDAGEAPLDAAGLLLAAGTVRATSEDGQVRLQPGPAPVPPPVAALPPTWLLVPVVLAVVLLPNLLALGDPGRDLRAAGDRRTGPLARLRRGRAAGFRRLALSAERRHRFGSAALWMGRSARWSHDPELRMQQAIFLRMAGRPGPALRRHRQAQEMFRMEGLVNALNSYEAARAAALRHRVEEALQWLLAAVREEPWLAQRAPFEPDLAPLRSLPAFMDVALAADPEGYLRP